MKEGLNVRKHRSIETITMHE